MTVIHAASFPQSLSDICHPVTQRQRSEGSQAAGRIWISERRITNYQSTDHRPTGYRATFLASLLMAGVAGQKTHPLPLRGGELPTINPSIHPPITASPITAPPDTASPVHQSTNFVEPLRGSIFTYWNHILALWNRSAVPCE
jgi:hypothetical protein